MIDEPVRPATVFCYNDVSARRAVRPAGLRVPGDVSIAGFDEVNPPDVTVLTRLLTDVQFWVPVLVLGLGLALLFWLQ